MDLYVETLIAKLKQANMAPQEIAMEEARLEQQTMTSLSELMAQYGIPKRHRRRLPNPDPGRTTAAVFEWMTRRCWCLVLSGSKGIGKSFAAAMFLWWTAKRKERRPNQMVKARWYRSVDLATMSSFDRDDRFQNLATLPELVIDDLGVECLDTKGNFKSRFDYVMDARYSEELPTIITMNMGTDDFKNRYGERVLDRLRDGGEFKVFNDESLRGKQKEKKT